MSQGLLIALVALTVAAGLYVWLRAPLARWRRGHAFGALAARLGADLEPSGRGFGTAGFVPTVVAVFGLHGRLRNVASWQRTGGDHGSERVTFFEYLYSLTGPWAWWRRKGSALVVAVEVDGLPMLTIRRRRPGTREGKTDVRVEGERLVVEIVDREIELWATERTRKIGRRLVTSKLWDTMHRDAKWDIRSMAGWLVLLHHAPARAQTEAALTRHLEAALSLRDALG